MKLLLSLLCVILCLVHQSLIVAVDNDSPTSTPTFHGEWYSFSNISHANPGSAWVSITSSADGRRLVLVDKFLGLRTSADEGKMWTLVPNTTLSGTSPYWWKVATSGNSQYSYVIQYSGGMVYASQDYGSSWNSIATLGENYWSTVTISDDGSRVYVAQSGGNITISSDYGATWKFASSGGMQIWKDMSSSVSGKIVVAVVYSGFIWISKNYGVDWTHDNNSPKKDWYAVTCSGDGKKMAAGEYLGNLYISLDGGKTWNIAGGTSRGRWIAVDYAADASVLAAADNGGNLYASRDDGETWTVILSIGQQHWQSLTVSYDGRKIYIITSSALYRGDFTFTTAPSSSSPTVSFRPSSSAPSSKPSSSAPSSKPSSSAPTSPPTSSSPTSTPSCGIGSAGTYNDCDICPPGTYTSSPGSIHCIPCPLGFFAVNFSSTECSPCEWPASTYLPGSSTCSGVFLNLTSPEYVLLYIFLAALLFITLFFIDKKNRMFAFILIIGPVADYITDILYLFSSRFYRPFLFWCTLASCLLPAMSFFHYLWAHKVYPRLWYSFMSPFVFLGSQRGLPTIFGHVVSFGITGVQGIVPGAPFYENIVSVKNCALLVPIWIVYILVQTLFMIPVSFLLVGSFLFSLGWFTLGIFLFQMKCFVSGAIWNYWLGVWTNDLSLLSYHNLDIAFLQEALFSEFFLETIPQVFFQIYNGVMIGNFSTIAVFSLIVSVLMTIYGAIRIFYFFFLLKFEFYSVPMVPQSIGKALYIDENGTEVNPMLSINDSKDVQDEEQSLEGIKAVDASKSLQKLLISSKEAFEVTSDRDRIDKVSAALEEVTDQIDMSRMSLEQLRKLRVVISDELLTQYDRLVLSVLGIDFGTARAKARPPNPSHLKMPDVKFSRLSSKVLTKLNFSNQKKHISEEGISLQKMKQQRSGAKVKLNEL